MICIKNTLETGGKMYSRMNVIRSQKHQLYTMQMNKVSLSAFDDKRWIKKDGISSYAYGHFRTLKWVSSYDSNFIGDVWGIFEWSGWGGKFWKSLGRGPGVL